MKAICVDDERILAEDIAEMCLELPEIDDVKSFIRAGDALGWLKEHPADLALLDINMPDMNGIELASEIKAMYPDMAVIFLKAYAQYAVDAFSVRAAGYLLKPVTKEALAADVAYALSGKQRRMSGHIVVKTFGSFDVYVDDDPVSFRLAKSKEIFAWLIDKHGSGVTRSEISSAVWEDIFYDRKMQKKLDNYLRSLRETLQEYGIADILDMEKGVIRVRPETIICDSWLFYAGDIDAINFFRGEYMSSYSWAGITESNMYWKKTIEQV
mgnify:CR=1 FL=1